MKAILDMTRIPQIPNSDTPLGVPCVLYPVLGKPFLQHTIEYIEQLGVDEIYVYLHNYAQEVESLIGDGERWGVKVEYFLIQKQADILKRIEVADFATDDEIVLFGNGLVLPMISKEQVEAGEELGFTDDENNCLQWALVKKGSIPKFDISSAKPSSPIEDRIPAVYLSVRNGKEYLESIKTAMDKKFSGLIIIGHEVRNGVWLGPGVRLPKTTAVVPPIFIHEQTMVGEKVSIGPYAEVGKGCVIDDESFITESAVCNYGYIGKKLDVKRSVIHKNQIFNCDVDTVYNATDEIFLSHTQGALKTKVPFVSRCIAFILFVLCLPVHILLTLAHLIKHGKGFKQVEVVRLPQYVKSDNNYETIRIRSYKNRRELEGPLVKHLFFVLIPGLGSIIAGKMRFCGLQPRTLTELSHMNDEWKELYLASSMGLISESEILYKTKPEEEMLYASDIFYSVNDSLSYNAKMVGKYIVRLFANGKRM